jgi:hypothetical protein
VPHTALPITVRIAMRALGVALVVKGSVDMGGDSINAVEGRFADVEYLATRSIRASGSPDRGGDGILSRAVGMMRDSGGMRMRLLHMYVSGYFSSLHSLLHPPKIAIPPAGLGSTDRTSTYTYTQW